VSCALSEAIEIIDLRWFWPVRSAILATAGLLVYKMQTKTSETNLCRLSALYYP